MAERLQEEMQCEVLFSLRIGDFEIPFSESVVITWMIMAIIVLICFLLTRNLKVDHISKRQAAVEYIVTFFQNMMKGMLGEEGQRYAQYLITVLIYLGFANTIGLIGFKPPTKDINVTAALAIMSIILIEASGIIAKGMKGFFKSCAQPVKLMTPFNTLEIVIRPVSLCMRLFGNVLGAFVVMELIKMILPVGLPVVFSLYFDIFDGLIQAYVFVFLTSLFIKESIEVMEK